MHRSIHSLSIISLLALSILVPMAAIGLDYSDSTGLYDDAPFSSTEEAGISVLTNLGVVEGNPDGNFYPGRQLNRAEFMKIVIGYYVQKHDDPFAGYDWYKNGSVQNGRCFPDVSLSQWFGMYICEGKDLGIVQGYPDGYFHPERPVNYVEAIKILAEIFDYALPEPPANERWTWYRPYLLAAQERGVALPSTIASDRYITRGQMARLAAAFVAQSEGELALYRAAERGEEIRSSAASSAASSRSSLSSVSSVSSSSSVSSVSSASASSSSERPEFPVRSHFLITGRRSRPIVGGTFVNQLEGMTVRGAEMRLEEEVPSIEAMYLVAEDGTELGRLYLDVFDAEDRTWKGSFPAEGAYAIPKREQRVLGVEVKLKDRDLGGVSADMVQAESFKLQVVGEDTQTAYESQSGSLNPLVYPKHQTSFGEITGVRSTLAPTGVFTVGPSQLLASFAFDADAVGSVSLAVDQLLFSVAKSADVSVSSWQLGAAGSTERHDCSVSGVQVVCVLIPASIGTIEGTKTLQLFGDVAIGEGATSPFLQVSFTLPGTIESGGAVRWTDGTGHFTWVDLGQPVAQGTMWR